MRAVGAYFRVTGQRPLTGNQVLTTWFTEAGPPPRHAALEKEAGRLATIPGRPLLPAVQPVKAPPTDPADGSAPKARSRAAASR